MKKIRNGFTLVELLIVIVVLGVISGSMLFSSGKSVAAAKAVKIVENMRLMRSAAMEYYFENINNSPSVANNSHGFRQIMRKYLGELAEKAGNSDKTSEKGIVNGDIKYIIMPGSNDAADEEWFVKCDFTNDPDREAIVEKLVELASKAQLLNDRNNEERTYTYYEMEDGKNVKKTYTWNGREIYNGTNYSRKNGYTNTQYKYVVYMRVK